MGKRKRESDQESRDPEPSRRGKPDPEDDEELSSVRIPDIVYEDCLDGPDAVYSQKKRVTFDMSFADGSPAKKKKRYDDDSFSEENGTRSKKSKQQEEPDDLEDEEFTYYLIRKPIAVSLDDLQRLKLPVDSSKSEKIKLRTETATYTLRPIETPKPLVYFPSRTIVTAKDAQKIRSGGLITRQAVLTRVQDEVAGGPIFGPGEDIPDDFVPSFEFKSIRKTPSVNWEDKKQRLFAFGVEKKKKPSKKEAKRKSRVKKEEVYTSD